MAISIALWFCEACYAYHGSWKCPECDTVIEAYREPTSGEVLVCKECGFNVPWNGGYVDSVEDL